MHDKKPEVIELMAGLQISHTTAYNMVNRKLPDLMKRYVEAARIRAKRKKTTTLQELGDLVGLTAKER